MKKVYSSQELAMVYHHLNILKNEGFDAMVQNENLYIASGQLPVINCWPELWVADSDYEEAKAIIDAALNATTPTGGPWKCPECGEEHEPQFSACWSCGEGRPE